MTLTKTAVKKLLADERKAMREKQKNSLFMRRTLSIYNGMKKRAAEHQSTLDYTVDELRDWTKNMLDCYCCHCFEKLTVKNFTWDHSIPIARGGEFSKRNLWCICASCNWQKGSLTSQEFSDLLFSMKQNLAPEAQVDVKRRLTIGGRWSWK